MRFGNFFGDGKVQAEKLYEKLISDEEEKVNYANTQSAFFRWGSTAFSSIEESYPSPGLFWWYKDSTNLFSNLFFNWINTVLEYGYTNTVEKDDLMILPKGITAQDIASNFKTKWASEIKMPNPNLVRVLYEMFKWEFLVAGIFRLFCEMSGLILPLVLEQLISHVECNSGHAPNSVFRGFGLSFVLLVLSVVQAICLQQYFHGVFLVGAKANSTILLFIFEKALRLPAASVLPGVNRGKVASLQKRDSEKLRQFVILSHNLWAAPLTAVGATAILISLLGPSALVGVCLIPLLVPLDTSAARIGKQLRRDAANLMEHRLALMKEIVEGIETVKLGAMEDHCKGKVFAVRNCELKRIVAFLRIDAFIQALLRAGPILVAMLTFVVYASTGHVLTAAKVFSAIPLFHALVHPFTTMQKAIGIYIEAKIAADRLLEFLMMDEVDHGPNYIPDSEPKLTFQGTDFTYTHQKEPVLKEIFLELGPGLITLIGKKGSGKSSLFSGILNELHCADKPVIYRSRFPSIAYCPAEPWVLSGTVRENIVVGSSSWDVDEAFYHTVVMTCGLDKDIKAWPYGEDTIIGERGIHLSIEQSVRLSLARALFSKCQVILLDNPLANLDKEMGKVIFEQAILLMVRKLGALVIMATNQAQYLEQANCVVVLEDGRIRANASFSDLVKKGLSFDGMLTEQDGNGCDVKQDAQKDVATKNGLEVKTTTGETLEASAANLALTKQFEWGEDHQPAEMGWSLYTDYVKTCGLQLVLCGVFLSIAAHVVNVSKEIVLAMLTDNASGSNRYLQMYTLICVAVIILNLLRFVLLYHIGNSASRMLHDKLLDNVLRAPLLFFETTPPGCITSRFSSDMEQIDTALPRAVSSFLDQMLTMGSAALVVVVTAPAFLFVLLPAIYACYWVQQYFSASSKELKRLESTTKTPIFSHFDECMEGLSSIRAYQIQDKMTEENQMLVDDQLRARLCSDATNRWLGIRLDIIGSVIIFCAAVSAVCFGGSTGGQVGLAITYAIAITKTLSLGVRVTASLQSSFDSSERVHEYLHLEPERLTAVPLSAPLLHSWPTEGIVRFEGIALRYRPDLDLVLNDISFCAKSQEKIGICGRSGSGKSSLVKALIRFVVPEQGHIFVDGADIRSIPLSTLRTKITVIPREMHLFSGSIREILDPFSKYSDGSIWVALERSGLKSFIFSMPLGIDSKITGRGTSWSIAQKQLFYLTRGLLYGSKIFVFDEATALVDRDAANQLQQLIHSQLTDCTVVIISQNPAEVSHCDRVIEMDCGKIVQVGKPEHLGESDVAPQCDRLAEELGIDALQPELDKEAMISQPVVPDFLS